MKRDVEAFLNRVDLKEIRDVFDNAQYHECNKDCYLYVCPKEALSDFIEKNFEQLLSLCERLTEPVTDKEMMGLNVEVVSAGPKAMFNAILANRIKGVQSNG